eukprot:978855-Rhodomonas_salina.1
MVDGGATGHAQSPALRCPSRTERHECEDPSSLLLNSQRSRHAGIKAAAAAAVVSFIPDQFSRLLMLLPSLPLTPCGWYSLLPPVTPFLMLQVVMTCAAISWRSMRPADTTSLEQEVHGTPAGWDPKKFAFQRVRPSIIHDTRNFAECIIAAGDISEGKACLSVYLSLLPKDLASEATSKGKDGFALAPEKDDPHKL